MRKTLIPAIATILLSAVSCSDWTTPEHLQYHKTPAELDPEGYENYLYTIKAYKQTEHRLMLVTMDGTKDYPSKQNQHPMSMPDSADYILMRNASGLHENIVSEIAQVREKKGTKSLVYVDYAVIDEAWRALKDAASEAGQPAPTPEEAYEFFKTASAGQVALCGQYGFHGIVVSFIGAANGEEKTKSLEGFLAPVTEWVSANPDKSLFLRGSIKNFKNEDLLKQAELYIVRGEDVASRVPMNQLVVRAIGSNVSEYGVVVELTVSSSKNPEQTGYTPVKAAQDWLLPAVGLDAQGNPSPGTKQDFVAAGLCVENAADDYYNTNLIYNRIRAGITAMLN